jgi:hypothetical protein
MVAGFPARSRSASRSGPCTSDERLIQHRDFAQGGGGRSPIWPGATPVFPPAGIGSRAVRSQGARKSNSSRCSSQFAAGLAQQFEFRRFVRQRSRNPVACSVARSSKRSAARRVAGACSNSAARLARATFSTVRALRTATVSRRPAKICGGQILSSASSRSPAASVSRCPARLPLSTLDT